MHESYNFYIIFLYELQFINIVKIIEITSQTAVNAFFLVNYNFLLYLLSIMSSDLQIVLTNK